MTNTYHIVFDALPTPDGPRFIEMENDAGRSITAGEWRSRPDGLAELVLPAPELEMAALTDDQVNAVLHLVESRLCIIWAKIGAREAFANELRVMEPVTEDEDAECCVACDVPFEEGDLVYWCSDDTGHLHADCCGPERESYTNADGNPLKDDEPIPAPFEWKPDRATATEDGR